MRVTVLGSGSTGNALLITAGGSRVLIDAGLSARETVRRLALVGEDVSQLSGIVITHEHTDHAGGLRVLLSGATCPVFITGPTHDAYIRERSSKNGQDEPRKRAAALAGRTVEIMSGQEFRIGAIDFHPFSIPHDAADNIGLTARHAGVKVAALMDFGHITPLINQHLRDCAAIVMESNHSRDMLRACAVYSWDLKQRILSPNGHLSNEDLADWLRRDFDGTARHIVLAHLSQRANNPYVAHIMARTALQERAPLFAAETEISLSHPKEPTKWLEF